MIANNIQRKPTRRNSKRLPKINACDLRNSKPSVEENTP
jgi:hypothetical protein